jgi:hypothetical protein
MTSTTRARSASRLLVPTVKTYRAAAARVMIAATVVSVQTVVTAVIVEIVVAAMIAVDGEIVVIAATVEIAATVVTVQTVVNVASVAVHRAPRATQSLSRSKMSSMPSCVATSVTSDRDVKHVATADTWGRKTLFRFERASTGNRDWLFCSKRLRSIT